MALVRSIQVKLKCEWELELFLKDGRLVLGVAGEVQDGNKEPISFDIPMEVSEVEDLQRAIRTIARPLKLLTKKAEDKADADRALDGLD